MAITLTSNQVEGAGFSQNGQSDDFSGTEALLAAVTGKSIYLEHIHIANGATARTVTIGAGESAGAVTTVLFGPISLAINGNTDIRFNKPIKLASATALVVDASGGSVGSNVIAEGFVQ